jgi:predicted RNase H-like nuclease (RuvC/YqgF family)
MKSKNEIIEEQQKTIEKLRSGIKILNGIYEVQDELIKNLERRLDVFTKRANDLRKERDDLSKQLEASKPFVCCCQRCRRRTDNDEK